MQKKAGNSRIGILGGTFDPIQIAHLAIAEQARACLGLREVLFIPAGDPWRKREQGVTTAEHRVAMVRLAIASNPFFRLSLIEVERPGPSYSVTTVEELQREFGPEAQLYFVMGMDALFDLPNWKEPERLSQLCRLVVMARPGYDRSGFSALDCRIPGLSERLLLLEAPLLDISSSDIRRRVAQGLPIRYLVPNGVERYIREHGLYRAE